MAIKGISDRRRMPRQGKIKLGEKRVSRNGKEYPVALDYFKVPEEVAAVYGESPKEIDIMFAVNDAEQVFPQFMKKYGKTGLRCKGDGETGMAMVNGEMVERECNPHDDPWCKDCQPKADLNYLLPKIPGFRTWQTTTSSWNSIVNINSSIDMIRAMTGGRIAFIPLKLKIEPHSGTVTKDDGSQFKKEVYVLNIDIDATAEEFYSRFARKQIAPSEEVLQIEGAVQDFNDMLKQDMEKREQEQEQVPPDDSDEWEKQPPLEPEVLPPESQPQQQAHGNKSKGWPIYAEGRNKGLKDSETKILVWVATKQETDSTKNLTEKKIAAILRDLKKTSSESLKNLIADNKDQYYEWQTQKSEEEFGRMVDESLEEAAEG